MLDNDAKKTCRHCGAQKALSQFNSNGAGGRRSYCKPCQSIRYGHSYRKSREQTVIAPMPVEPSKPPKPPEVSEVSEATVSAPPPKAHTVAILGDTHFPYASAEGLRQAYEVIERLQPTVVVQIGDLLDCYSFSRHPHKVSDPTRELSDGREQAAEMWKTVQRLCGATCYQLRGNHDDRILKSALYRAPELADIVGRSVDELFRFENVVSMRESQQELVLDGVYYIHGYKSRIGEHTRWANQNTVTGHLHRGGLVMVHRKWELNAGWLGDRHSHVFDYRNQRTLDGTTLGMGLVDQDGPRFIPFE